MARYRNVTGVCQMCGKKLGSNPRSDKMTCGLKKCASKWTRFYKKVKGAPEMLPAGLRSLAYSPDYENTEYHVIELFMERYKEWYDHIGEALSMVEERQGKRAKNGNYAHSSQYGFYSNMKKRPNQWKY